MTILFPESARLISYEIEPFTMELNPILSQREAFQLPDTSRPTVLFSLLN